MTMAQPISGSSLRDDHHVLRYIGKKHVDNGVVNGSGFLTRPQENAPSVNWMEYFALPVINQVSEITSRRRMRYEKNALLVRLNVGHTRRFVGSNSPIPVELSFIHDPLPAENGKPEDPSHAIVTGVPVIETPEGELIKDLLTHCILERFPVVPDR
jgi:hypothetical protein